MSDFQRRHYRFVAETIAEIPDPWLRVQVQLIFSAAFKRNNPGFKPDLFKSKCGITEEVNYAFRNPFFGGGRSQDGKGSG